METINRIKVNAEPSPILMRKDHYLSAKVRHLTDSGFHNVTEGRVDHAIGRIFGGYPFKDVIDQSVSDDILIC